MRAGTAGAALAGASNPSGSAVCVAGSLLWSASAVAAFATAVPAGVRDGRRSTTGSVTIYRDRLSD